ncbi:cytochrome c oxidase subunit 2 [Rarobacter faecitabidus]|uniref:cytochrome-c oxidase n=2 Tax=Rarobacter faecitabidus TaxID=13243 RepID=A0A542ZVQ0_RARFA|nr:cytochrome c oxidase subunit II [Rarobacter faecitabidus]TQL64326.1 cytochrome c oxidase subunit 2 [Rarobacter faecitabidus]
MLVLAVCLVALAGCTPLEKRGYLPGFEDGHVTNQTERITHLWVGSWISALIVGIITWGLMIWCVIAYRKRKGDNKLPTQTRYHVPLEMMYVIVPLVMIGGLYYFTVRDQMEVRDISADADLTVEVIGKQWSWDFNYLEDAPRAAASLDADDQVTGDFYVSGIQAQSVGTLNDPLHDSAGEVIPGTDESLPTLVLPVDKVVQFNIYSRDVIHSFWIPAFLDKMDMVPGRANTWQVTPTRVGTYAGKCAELCGEYHSGMLFNVKVVTQDEFDAWAAEQREDHSGRLGLDLNRLQDGGQTTRTKEHS